MLLIGEALRERARARKRTRHRYRARCVAVTTVTRSSSLTKYGTSFAGSLRVVAGYALTVNQTWDANDSAQQNLRVLLVDDGSPHIALLDAELTRLGVHVLGVLDSAVELVARAHDLQPDVIIIAADSPTRDTLEHLAVMSQSTPRPIVLFTDDPDRERMQRALKAGVSSYVVEGLSKGRLGSVLDVAVARFEADTALRAELAAALGKLSARKKIEQRQGNPDAVARS